MEVVQGDLAGLENRKVALSPYGVLGPANCASSN